MDMDNNVMTNSDKDALNKAGGEDEYFYIRDVWFWSAIAGKVNIVHFSSPLQREMNIGKAESRRIYLVGSINDDFDHPPARLRHMQGGSVRAVDQQPSVQRGSTRRARSRKRLARRARRKTQACPTGKGSQTCREGLGEL